MGKWCVLFVLVMIAVYDVSSRPGSKCISTTSRSTSTTTLSPEMQLQCIRDCPATAEYNPVCGSNDQTYSNPGRLICAQSCGLDVTQVRFGPCSNIPDAN